MAELTFPSLEEAAEPWQWPAPPFAKWALHAVDDESPQPCTLEAASGDTFDGELVGFDPAARQLRLRTGEAGPVLTLPFVRFTRLTLPGACRLTDVHTREPFERLPVAAQEREYRLDRPPPLAPFAGHTLGHVEAPEGVYLYPPLVREQGVQRVFVPRNAFEGSHFGVSVEDAAAEHWISAPRELLQAIATQHQRPVLPIGQALLALGMATPEQLLKAMAEPLGDMPLGERLVATGVISQGDLHTAIAHKMGYPVVDLTRFPIDPAAVGKLPMRAAFSCLAVPLLIHGVKLVLAVDRPARLEELRDKHVLHDLAPVAVVAPRSHIKLTLMHLSHQQPMWSGSVMRSAGFFPATG
ncbi:MAG: hypothetical protein AB1430_21390 [Pseudomonadota bacterium]